MGFNMMILAPAGETVSDSHEWTSRLRELIPDMQVSVARSIGEAMELVSEADAAHGDIVPQIFERAERLKWISCPYAGPKAGYYHQALIDSDVVVTNTRGIYPFISAHIMAFVLSFARGFPVYFQNQREGKWEYAESSIYLATSTAVIVGVGGIGAEAARLCAEFGINVLAVDPRVDDPPPGVAELHRPEALHSVLPRADFVIVTVPETPQTRGFFGAEELRLMKDSAYLINIGRGANVRLDDLNAALRGGEIAGAGLDVFEIEPLPSDHPLWTAPGMLITPHVAAAPGPDLDDRRTELFFDNCVRFNEGRPLRNLVDKAAWF